MMAPVSPDERTVLVVEDDPDVRQSLSLLLQLEGFSPAQAQNGSEALEYLHHHRPPCLVLLDLMMPVMTGWEFLDRKEHDPDPELVSLPVVICSGVARMPATPPLPDVKAVLLKPVDPERLLRTVCACCRPPAEPPAEGRP